MQTQDPKGDTGSGNDDTNEMLEHERLIDPGNEHSHNDKDPQHTAADADGNAPGSAAPQPEEKQEPKSPPVNSSR